MDTNRSFTTDIDGFVASFNRANGTNYNAEELLNLLWPEGEAFEDDTLAVTYKWTI